MDQSSQAEGGKNEAIRTALMDSAEILIAKHGVAEVSLKQINQMAGARNASAVHYHFGSREGLVIAVIKRRIAEGDSWRRDMLDAIDRQQRHSDLRTVIDATVGPMARFLTDDGGTGHYFRFVERVMRAPDHDFSKDLPEVPGWVRVNQMLQRLLAYLPPQIADHRIQNIWTMCVSSLAHIEAQLERGEINRDTARLYVEALIDMLADGAGGRISLQTMELSSRNA